MGLTPEGSEHRMNADRLNAYGAGQTRFNVARQVVGRFIASAALLLATFAMTSLQAARAADRPTILALGDSLTAGYGLPAGEAFPVKLQEKLKMEGVDVTIVNAGVSGDTSAGGLARTDWSLADHPRYAILALGANDALRGTDPKATADNLDKILDKLDAAGVKTLILGMKALANFGPGYEQQFDAIYPALAAKHHALLYPFFLDGVALDPSLNQADGIHPNPKGVAIIVDKVAPYVRQLVGQAG